jgi:UDPglucose 6-dehydrogenase
MNVGIVGFGVVGKVIGQAFSMQGHTIKWYDKHNAESIPLKSLMDCDCVFVCVPTDTINNTCDISQVNKVIGKMSGYNYSGVIVIKSTVVPGTTQSLLDKHPNLRISFVPEFLRQDNALDDFLHTKFNLIVGTNREDDYKFIVELHKPYNPTATRISPTEAELAKYFSNNFNSLRIVFANTYYEVCNKLNADYQNVLNSVVTLPAIGHEHYLKCNSDLRGYGGKCLPKDMLAFNTFVKELNLPITLFDAIINDNTIYTKN